MAKARIKRTAARSSSARRPAVTPPTNDGATAAIMGWLLFIGVVAATAYMMVDSRRSLGANAERRAREAAAYKADFEERQAAAIAERTRLQNAINDQVERHNTAADALKTAKKGSRLAQTPPAPTRRVSKKAPPAPMAIGDDSLSPLRTRLSTVTAEKNALKDEYRALYETMRERYESALAAADVTPMREFYLHYSHTPFGPAAGYHLGEKLYANGRRTSALRQYRDVVREFAHTVYGQHARARAEQVERQERYVERPVEFVPYKALSFVR